MGYTHCPVRRVALCTLHRLSLDPVLQTALSHRIGRSLYGLWRDSVQSTWRCATELMLWGPKRVDLPGGQIGAPGQEGASKEACLIREARLLTPPGTLFYTSTNSDPKSDTTLDTMRSTLRDSGRHSLNGPSSAPELPAPQVRNASDLTPKQRSPRRTALQRSINAPRCDDKCSAARVAHIWLAVRGMAL